MDWIVWGIFAALLVRPIVLILINVHLLSFVLGAITVMAAIAAAAALLFVYGPQDAKRFTVKNTPRLKKKEDKAVDELFISQSTRAVQTCDLDAPSIGKLFPQTRADRVDETGKVVYSSWVRIAKSPLPEDKLKEKLPGPLSFTVTHAPFRLPPSLAGWLMQSTDDQSDARELLYATMTSLETFSHSRHSRNRKSDRNSRISKSTQYEVEPFESIRLLESSSATRDNSISSFSLKSFALSKLSAANARSHLNKLLRNPKPDSSSSELKQLPRSDFQTLEQLDLDIASKDNLLARAFGLCRTQTWGDDELVQTDFPLLTPMSVLRALDKTDRNVFAVLRASGNLTFYSDETCLFPLETFSVREFDIRLWPLNKLLNNEAYLKIYPVHFAPKAASKCSDELFFYFRTPLSKESFYLALYDVVHRVPSKHSHFYLDTIDRFRYAVFYPFGFYEFLGASQYVPHSMKSFDHGARLVDSHGKRDKGSAPLQINWLNALIARGFVALSRSVQFREGLLRKLNRKVARVDRPSFLSEIVVKDVSMGCQAPVLANPQLLEMDANGSVQVNLTMAYAGGFKMLLNTTVTIPSPTKLVNPVQVPIQVTVQILKLCGDFKLMFRPLELSNRMWIGFYPEPAPLFEADVELVVGHVGLRWNWIKAQLMEMVRKLFHEQLVLPNMDDMDFGDPGAGGGVFDNLEASLETLQAEQRSAYDALILSETSHQTELATTVFPKSLPVRKEPSIMRRSNLFSAGEDFSGISLSSSSSSSSEERALYGVAADVERSESASPPILGSPPRYNKMTDSSDSFSDGDLGSQTGRMSNLDLPPPISVFADSRRTASVTSLNNSPFDHTSD